MPSEREFIIVFTIYGIIAVIVVIGLWELAKFAIGWLGTHLTILWH